MFEIKEINYNNKNSFFELNIEGEIFFISYEDFEANSLSIGDILDMENYKTLKAMSNRNLGLAKALSYCANKFVSSFKLREYLRRKGIDGESIDMIIDHLNDNGILNDQLYLEYYIKDKMKLNMRSKKRIYQDLLLLGFDREKISFALEDFYDIDESSIVLKLIEKKKNNDLENENKLTAYFARQGFSYDAIKLGIKKAIERREIEK